MLHSMATSANADRPTRTAREISRCARRLAAERGLDGFTMDQLAEEVGVSRRTLFNHVPGKIDAILGAMEEPDDELVATFLAGGPSGRLLPDVTEMVRSRLTADGLEAAEVDIIRQLVRNDQRLQQAMHERFVRAAAELHELVECRAGAQVDPLRSRLIVTVVVGLLDVALDESLADPSLSLADHYARVFETVATLFTR